MQEIRAINKRTFKNRMSEYRKNPKSFILFLLVILAAVITAAVLIFIIGYVLVQGIPHLKPSLFEWTYNSENVSLLPSLITTIEMTILSLVIAVPLGVCTAIYLVEYAKRGNKVVGLIRIMAETLSGIPSIVYGLFGLLLFVTQMGLGFSLIAGALTLAIMILPLIIRTTEEALIAVPDMYREASFGLGAGRLRTIIRVVLPASMPGILAGVILGVGRIVGETAALIYTAGTATDLPDNVLSSGRTLAIHMYSLASEGLYTDEAYATAVVLLVVVALINAGSAAIAKRLASK